MTAEEAHKQAVLEANVKKVMKVQGILAKAICIVSGEDVTGKNDPKYQPALEAIKAIDIWLKQEQQFQDRMDQLEKELYNGTDS